MNKDTSFAETVILIDAGFLNILVTDFKKNFERMLQRPLQDMDVSDFITYLALDASVPKGDEGVQVILVYDEGTPALSFCRPSSLKDELDGVAFRNHLGEFRLTSVSPEGIASAADLYIDLLEIIADCADTKRMIIVPFGEEYMERVIPVLEEAKGKEKIVFGMNNPEHETAYQWQMLAFPVMQALGIKGEELP